MSRRPKPLAPQTPVEAPQAHLGLGVGATHPGTLDGCAACARYAVEHEGTRLPAGMVLRWEHGAAVIASERL